MRNDSCRKCGNQMKIKEKCKACKEAITFSCIKCNFETDELIHLKCAPSLEICAAKVV